LLAVNEPVAAGFSQSFWGIWHCGTVVNAMPHGKSDRINYGRAFEEKNATVGLTLRRDGSGPVSVLIGRIQC
jgi:hypothetical protein